MASEEEQEELLSLSEASSSFSTSTSATRPIVAVVFGLPGAGKTSLCKALISLTSASASSPSTLLKKRLQVEHVCFDDIEQELLSKNPTSSSSSTSFSPEVWHQTRNIGYQRVESLIEDTTSRDTTVVVLVDDNMYYFSMRHKFFNLARKRS